MKLNEMNKKLFNVIATIILFGMPNLTFGQAPNLGSAANFVLFSSVGALTNSSPSLLTGNVGSNGGSSTGFGNVNGVMDNDNGVSAACSADLLSAYNQLNSTIPNFFPSSLLGGGDTLIAGVYSIAAAATMNGNLILDAHGNANAVFIFQIGGSFATGANAKVILINGALACNVFWKVEGLVSMAPGTTMRGTIIANNAGITMGTNDTLEGRALSTTGAVSVGGVLAYTPVGCGSPTLTGPSAPALGSTACYGLFSANGPVSNAGSTHVSGDVGTNVGLTTGFNPLFVAGTIHPIPDGSTVACAADLLNAYSYLNTLPADIELLYPAQFGNNLVLTPHTYVMNSATTFTGNVYLNGAGDSNAVFVLQLNGALTTSTFSNVILMNGTQAKNVFWKVEGAVEINDYSVFNGTIICNNGAVSLNTGVSLNGRALTTAGALGAAAITVIMPPGCGLGCIAPAIGGSPVVCIGATTALNDIDTGGSWKSSASSVATIDSTTGIVTGIAAGTTRITYQLSGGCTNTIIVTVNTTITGTISGASIVNTGENITLTDAIAGGTWSASNANATVSGGVVTGLTAGSVIISYAVGGSCGTAYATKLITVNNSFIPVIGGVSSICAGTTTSLSDAITGGVWNSSNGGIATVNATTGVVSGVSAGTATITYTQGGAYATITVTINAIPLPIHGATSACAGTTITLSDNTSGGTWSSTGDVSVVATGTNSATVSEGATSGTGMITYTLIDGCYITYPNTVLSGPSAIFGTTTVCAGAVTILSDSTATGVSWTSSNTLVATVLNTGHVTGVSAGFVIITYKSLPGNCIATAIITVLDQPASITGNAAVCAGNVLNLNDASGAGVWSSSNAGIAIVGSGSGILTGVAAGTARITYTSAANGCMTTAIVTVNTILPITGGMNVCTGTTTTLSDASAGGTWSSGNAGIAAVGASNGLVTGVSVGSVSIMYTLTSGCIRTTTINVGTIGAITGNMALCASGVTTLNNITAGGTWSISNTLLATIGSISGVVTAGGVNIGTATISYTAGGCVITGVLQVNAKPLPVQGAISECAGTMVTLTDNTSGGIWSITGDASISGTGVLTAGVVAGTATITYTIGTGCFITYPNTVIKNPSAIFGVLTVCAGSVTILSDSSATGVSWTSSNTLIATVPPTGHVTGVASGTAIITYKALPGNCIATAIVTVNAAPIVMAIAGPTSIPEGSPMLLNEVTGGGVWSSSHTSVIVLSGSTGSSITATAIASSGSSVISYVVTNGMGCTTTETLNIVVGTLSAREGSGAEGSAIVNEQGKEVLLYPNPTNGGTINVKANAGGDFYLYSLDGRVLGGYKISVGVTNVTLPSNLSAGIYMGRYVGEDGNIALFRIVKE